MMNRLKHWLSFPLRYRSSRGFGIHSPFAFRFVREVLMERLPYYAFGDLNHPWLRLIFRLVCYFRPADVLILGSEAEEVAAVIRRCDTRIRVSCDLKAYHFLPAFIIVGENALSECDIPDIERMVADGGTLVIRDFSHNAELSALLYRSVTDIGHGMGFSNDKTAVFVGLRHLPAQQFRLTFRS